MSHHGSHLPRSTPQFPLFPLSQRCLTSPPSSETPFLMHSPPKRLKRDHSLIDDFIPTPPPLSPTCDGTDSLYPFPSFASQHLPNEHSDASNSSWILPVGVDHARIGVQSADQLVPQPPCPHCQQTLPRGFFLQQSLLISSQQIAQRISEVKKEITQVVASLDMSASIPQANPCRESLNPFDFLPMVTDAFVRSSEALSEDDAFASLVSPPAPVRLPEIASMNANGISLSSLLTDLRPTFAVDGSGDMREDSTKPLQDCGSIALQPETQEAVGGPDACPWQKLARISPRPEPIASLLASQGLVHVKKNVLRETVAIPKGHRIIKAVGLAFPFTGVSAYEALADIESMNKLYQTEFSLKVTPPPTKNGTWCLKMSSEDSTQIFRDFSTEMPVQVVFGILISARPDHSVWELHALEPFCTVTHIRYTPQALFGYSHYVRKSQTDADMIQFVTSEILKQKSPNQKCGRPLAEHDIAFFRHCLVDNFSKSRDIQLVHLIESKKFEKLNGSNEWISKIVETWSQDEVHRLWEQNVINGFLLDEIVAQSLWEAPDMSYFVHFNEDKMNPNSLVVSLRRSNRIVRILIQIDHQKKRTKTGQVTKTYTLHAGQLGSTFP
eukprot:TRINITY_DN371_c0_g1_i2.p1 TRINITY_DN371_c0_g1~~TRINITY_DN371_c0_g1_i2.p1  ORF type:complete len:611 (+),score=120.67 TRINITY_DN371_c0_g1_i2:55-1887(+)